MKIPVKWLFAACLRVANGREADVVIRNTDGSDYLTRWWIIPRNKYFNIYLHHFQHPDDDRALHDHPWWNLSLLLAGNYIEWRPVGQEMFQHSYATVRYEGNVYVRKPEASHRVDLFRDLLTAEYLPVWTLFVTGPNVRTWGFWCKRGWIPWTEFTSKDRKNVTSKGCGE